MAEKTLIMATSGSGKTTSLRNLNLDEVMVIQPINKRLPFPSGKDWKLWDKDSLTGSRFITRDLHKMKPFMKKMVDVGKKIIVIDDFVYCIAGQVMDQIDEVGFDKWNQLAKDVHSLMEFIDMLPEDVRVYVLTHTEEDSNGNIKMKTAGKLIDNLLTPEGMFTTVLGATFTDGKYKFKTQKERNSEPYKSPMGMFKDVLIDNDLKVIDDIQVKYYGITNEKKES
ncbi:MAG: hypothetical protein L3I99_01830 [Sulfurimonas sp.]|nr:hypothetical protein [Sulfurimonas sp.]